jgi:hypothetical protein
MAQRYQAMSIEFRLKTFCAILVACLALQVPTKGVAQSAGGSVLASSQILKTADLTPDELYYYNKISEPEVAKNFIITRSYMRICQNIIDNKIPADQLPSRPTGFSAKYLFDGDDDIISAAIKRAISAKLSKCPDPSACLRGK